MMMLKHLLFARKVVLLQPNSKNVNIQITIKVTV